MIIRSMLKNYKVDFLKLKNAYKTGRIPTSEYKDKLDLISQDLKRMYAKVKDIYNEEIQSEIQEWIIKVDKERFYLMPTAEHSK